MKRIIAFTMAFAMAGFSLSAQQTREVKQQKSCDMKCNHMQQAHKGNRMKDLNLSDAQKTQMKANREAGKAKMTELNKQDNLTVKEMNKRKAALQQEQKNNMEALLTTDQKNQIAANKSAMQAKRIEKGEKHAAMLKEKLGLSDDQSAKLKTHQQITQGKMKSVQENKSLTIEQKKEQIKSLRDAAMVERKSIFTAEQLQKMDEMKKNRTGRKGPKAVK
jgi:hypothetical protein